MNAHERNNGTSTDTSSRFIFREVRTAGELLDMLKLRYRVYRASRISGFCPINTEQIDVDENDQCARHFGLYETSEFPDKLVGSIRIVSEDEDRHVPKLQSLAACSQLVGAAIRKRPETPLPTCNYSATTGVATRLYSDWRATGEHVVDGGRLCLEREHRNLRLAVFVAEMTFALGFFGDYDVDRALVTCCKSHERFYTSYGYYHIPGIGTEFWDKPQVQAVALMATPSDIRQAHRGRLIALASQFDYYGYVILEAHLAGGNESRTRLARVA